MKVLCFRCVNLKQAYLREVARDESLQRVMRKMQVGHSTGRRFFKAFYKLDKRDSLSSGIDICAFFRKIRYELTPFAETMLARVDDAKGDGDGRLQFAEFFVGILNYCSLDHDQYVMNHRIVEREIRAPPREHTRLTHHTCTQTAQVFFPTI